MTTSEEWSVNFDILYNNISSDQAPGLTEYEKSVFLTQAQEAVILDLYKGTSGDAFETTEEVTRYLSSLVKSTTLDLAIIQPNEEKTRISSDIKEYLAERAKLKDILAIVYQSCLIITKTREREDQTEETRDVLVVPTKQDTLFKDLNNPFKGPNKNKVLSSTLDSGMVVYSKYPIKRFYIRYLKTPTPIVLDNSKLEISGVSNFKVEIPESLHNQVLYKAVQLAKAVWQS